MLQNSFIQLPGIGAKKEMSLWKSGILNWKDLISENKYNYDERDKNNPNISIETCIERFAQRDATYFYQILPPSQSWRLLKNSKMLAYTLISRPTEEIITMDFITTIATYDGNNIRYYINGQNLDEFINDVSNYKILITYNGKSFDIPLHRKLFQYRTKPCSNRLKVHIEKFRYKGGLKSCEKQLGLSRSGLEGVDGYFAIHLWNDYYYNTNQKALETLLAV